MTEMNETCYRAQLERLTTPRLDEMLQAELRKEAPDENVVLPILEVLEQREAGQPVVVTEQAAAAWEKYRKNIEKPAQHHIGKSKTARILGLAAVVCLIVMAIPLAVGADNALDILYRLTDSVIEFFDPGRKPSEDPVPYVFATDNDGLQQVYDRATELGITAPVVPMWLPEGYELTELDVDDIPSGKRIQANFIMDEQAVFLTIKITEEISSTKYEREVGETEEYEVGGIDHMLISNENRWSVKWYNDGVECLLVAEMDKEEIYSIIRSIYRRNPK